MILFQGCSFTFGEGLQHIRSRDEENFHDQKKFKFSSFVERELDEKCVNISGVSKDNFTMYFELHAYLLYCRHDAEGGVKPRVIVWQLSDTFRKGVIDWNFSGSWKPNNLRSLIGNYHRRFIKTVSWSGYNGINSNYKKLLKEDPIKSVKYKRQMGMGSKLELNGQTLFNIGDETFQHNELLIGMHINTIQEMCKQSDIQLVIMNYYGTPTEMLEDPIHKNIDRSNYLIENSERWGMYNHLCWRGFDRSVDDYHFNVDGHYYQADILVDYLRNGKRLKVEEVIHDDMNHMPVFDYTDASTSPKDSTKEGKKYLLNLAK